MSFLPYSDPSPTGLFASFGGSTIIHIGLAVTAVSIGLSTESISAPPPRADEFVVTIIDLNESKPIEELPPTDAPEELKPNEDDETDIEPIPPEATDPDIPDTDAAFLPSDDVESPDNTLPETDDDPFVEEPDEPDTVAPLDTETNQPVLPIPDVTKRPDQSPLDVPAIEPEPAGALSLDQEPPGVPEDPAPGIPPTQSKPEDPSEVTVEPLPPSEDVAPGPTQDNVSPPAINTGPATPPTINEPERISVLVTGTAIVPGNSANIQEEPTTPDTLVPILPGPIDPVPGPGTEVPPDNAPDIGPIPGPDTDTSNDNVIEPILPVQPDQSAPIEDEILQPGGSNELATPDDIAIEPDNVTVFDTVTDPSPQQRMVARLIQNIRSTAPLPCAVALPRLKGDNSVALSYVGLDVAAIDQHFGASVSRISPSIETQRIAIDQRQCAALEAVRATGAYPANRIGLAIDNTQLVSGDTLNASILGAGGLTVELLLIDDNGVVQDLSRFATLNGETLQLDVPVARSGTPRETPQILLVLGSDGEMPDLRSQFGQEADQVFSQISESELEQLVFAFATFQVQ